MLWRTSDPSIMYWSQEPDEADDWPKLWKFVPKSLREIRWDVRVSEWIAEHAEQIERWWLPAGVSDPRRDTA